MNFTGGIFRGGHMPSLIWFIRSISPLCTQLDMHLPWGITDNGGHKTWLYLKQTCFCIFLLCPIWVLFPPGAEKYYFLISSGAETYFYVVFLFISILLGGIGGNSSFCFARFHFKVKEKKRYHNLIMRDLIWQKD